jgi:ABC-type Fe3+/spermidine/putrescine transport system ATPase subunit
MLDIALREVTWVDRKSTFYLGPLSLEIPRESHTALVGPGGGGKSLLLRLIAGEIYPPTSGEISLGTRNVTALAARRRPVFHTAETMAAPDRWSVRHVLVSAARQHKRSFDERMAAIDSAAARWGLSEVLDRKLGSLADSGRVRARLAQIELLRPAIVLIERLFAPLSPSDRAMLAPAFHEALRASGATVVSEVSSWSEVALCDRVTVLEEGRIVQLGTPADVYRAPVSRVAAEALGEVNAIPVIVRDGEADSPIGRWAVPGCGIEGSGFALLRPEDFEVAAPGEESDFILGIEEATFAEGSWKVRGLLSGGTVLCATLRTVVAPPLRRPLPLRFARERATIVAGEHEGLGRIPLDLVPPIAESR